ncbi:beta-xylosidase [Paraburkholderia sp. BR10954]
MTFSTDYCAPMNSSPYSCRVAAGAASLALLGAALLAANSPSLAQIPQSGGSSHMESRSSGMGSTPDPGASAVHESLKPQSKDSGQGNARGKTAGQGQKAEGAGGFNNGLYGTGAGSNK